MRHVAHFQVHHTRHRLTFVSPKPASGVTFKFKVFDGKERALCYIWGNATLS